MAEQPVTQQIVSALQAQLQDVGFRVIPDEQIRKILTHENVAFRTAVASVAANQDGWEERLQYLRSVVTAASDSAAQIVHDAVGYRPSFERLLQVAKSEGSVFTEAVRALVRRDLDDGTRRVTISYLLRLFDRMREGVGIEDLWAAGESGSDTEAGSCERTPLVREQIEEQSQPSPGHNVTHLRGRQDSGEPESSPPPIDESEAATDTTSQPRETRGPKAIESLHLYGGKAAFCFEPDVTVGTPQRPTVRIEAAAALAAKRYDWANKIAFQLTPAEIGLVLGVFLGMTSEAELLGHGKNNEKSLVLKNQGASYFISMRVRGRDGDPLAMPIVPRDSLILMGLLWRQLKANMPDVSEQFMLSSLKRVCEMTENAKPSKRAANA